MADSVPLAPLSFWRSPAVRRVLAGGVLLAGGLVLERLGFGHAWVIPLYLASILLAGADWVRHGWEELVHCREVGIEALMIATDDAESHRNRISRDAGSPRSKSGFAVSRLPVVLVMVWASALRMPSIERSPLFIDGALASLPSRTDLHSPLRRAGGPP